MAIQSRRGEYENFDPAKMLPGEWACVTNGDPGASDGKSVYMCFEAGKVKRMATYDDMKDSINEATQDVQKEFLDGASEDLQQATKEAQSAAERAAQAASDAESSVAEAEKALELANDAVASANAAADRANEAADNVKNDFYGARSTFPETGEANKLYIDNTVNPAISYIWNGSGYVPAGGVGSAKDLDYDNSTSGLTSTNVQGAIDENAAAINALNSSLAFKTKNLGVGITAVYNDYMVTISFSTVSKTYNAGTWTTIAEIPEYIRPAIIITFSALNNDVRSDTDNTPVWARITTDGYFQIYAYSDRTEMNPIGSVSYAIS